MRKMFLFLFLLVFFFSSCATNKEYTYKIIVFGEENKYDAQFKASIEKSSNDNLIVKIDGQIFIGFNATINEEISFEIVSGNVWHQEKLMNDETPVDFYISLENLGDIYEVETIDGMNCYTSNSYGKINYFKIFGYNYLIV